MIYINGVIGNDKSKGQISLLDVVSQCQNDTEHVLRVFITSNGGDTGAGFSIYNFLKNYKERPVHTYATGMCDSIASVIFCAGEKRFIGCDMTIHNPAIDPVSLKDENRLESEDLSFMAEVLDKIKKDASDVYKEVSGVDDLTLSSLMDKETKISPEEALKIGFATDLYRIAPVLLIENPNKININQKKEEMEKNLLDEMKTLVESVQMLFKKKQPEAKMLTIIAADGTEIELDKEVGEPQVGDTADKVGRFLMPNGETLVIEEVDGVIQIVEIIPEEDTTQSEEMKALKLEVSQLKNEIQRLKTENLSVTNLLKKTEPILEDYKLLKQKELPISLYTPEMRLQKERKSYDDTMNYIEGKKNKLNKKGE